MAITIQVGVKVPALLHAKLKEDSTVLKVSKSEVVLSALAQYLDSASVVPLAVRMTEVERRLAVVEALVKPA